MTRGAVRGAGCGAARREFAGAPIKIRRFSLGLVLVLATVACASGSSTAGPSSGSRVTPTPSPPISSEWTEYHRDAGRSGAGPAEPSLSSPKVAWTMGVDGSVYAAQLIAAGPVIVVTA